MGVRVYGVEGGGFLCGSSYGSSGGSMVWVFSVSLGLRYRLLWFWVIGWPRGVGMVRKWKWYLLTL